MLSHLFFTSKLIFAISISVIALSPALAANADNPKPDLQVVGTTHFFEGRIKESLMAWDAYLLDHPKAAPYHWQRGIALYYAERWADGRAQFESHVTVNPQDVENSVWHFLCVARQKSIEEARRSLLPVTKDMRVPMAQVLKLFAGTGSSEEVLRAANHVTDSEAKRDALCFAHLYLGLYAEASGSHDSAKTHLLQSAVDFSMPHYMGRVAKLHCEIRGWLKSNRLVR